MGSKALLPPVTGIANNLGLLYQRCSTDLAMVCYVNVQTSSHGDFRHSPDHSPHSPPLPQDQQQLQQWVACGEESVRVLWTCIQLAEVSFTAWPVSLCLQHLYRRKPKNWKSRKSQGKVRPLLVGLVARHTKMETRNR